jgi:hypothetical protein
LVGKLPFALGLLLLAAQLAGIVYSRFTPLRYFCWAPFDQQTQYVIGVEVSGDPLSDLQIEARYRRGASGSDNRSAHHLFDIIERAEGRIEPEARGRVRVLYRINGGPEAEWRYPRP